MAIHPFFGLVQANGIDSKAPEGLEQVRQKGLERDIMVDWYQGYANFLYVSDRTVYPANTWNFDETFVAVGKTGSRKVLGSHSHSFTKKVPKRGKHFTLLVAYSAASNFAPPLLICPTASISPKTIKIVSKLYPELMLAGTSTGWITNSTFYSWFSKSFLPHIEKTAQGRHMIFCDGHGSHSQEKVVNLANKQSHDLILLPPHSSSATQPFDLACARSFKSSLQVHLMDSGDDSDHALIIAAVQSVLDMRKKDFSSSFDAPGLCPPWPASNLPKLPRSVEKRVTEPESPVDPEDEPAEEPISVEEGDDPPPPTSPEVLATSRKHLLVFLKDVNPDKPGFANLLTCFKSFGTRYALDKSKRVTFPDCCLTAQEAQNIVEIQDAEAKKKSNKFRKKFSK